MVEFAEFKREIMGGNVSPIYLFEGEETFLFESAISDVKQKFVACPDLDFVTIEGSETNANELYSQILAFPFASQKRVVVVKEYYPNASEISVLKDIFTNPPSDSVFIIANVKNTENVKKQKNVTVVKCLRQDGAVIVKWIQRELMSNGVEISPQLALKIAEYSLFDMWKVSNETQKLLAYLGERGSVTNDDVESVVVKDAEYKIYEMTEQVGKRNFDGALTILNEMLSNGEPAQKLLVSIYYYYRKLFHLVVSDKSESELAVSFKSKEFAITKMKKQAKTFKPKSLKSAIDMLADYDFYSKSGVMTIDSALILSVFKLLVG